MRGPRYAAGRSRAMPHIKTYARVCSDGRLPWLLLTSSNLSEQRRFRAFAMLLFYAFLSFFDCS